MRYVVEWYETAYDAFDDLEGQYVREPFEIQTDSLGEAEHIANNKVNEIMCAHRTAEMWQRGWFEASVTSLTDEHGMIHRP